ncbi:MAG: AAA family ATPase [Rickettsia endosymbiont of Ixodes persulcatus]|nr:AAA family ATPase [Rickettsia endosymbiont of Ixodes persulcatus]MCZ6903003.1 AAA family ATPase [Rickettsia endosymbiont of Ixodes persulcatus]MCZ6909285.1 AAA family ATPase [Rickettsia endosymbiont of Ixodes persulcatus]MCZ6911159.1 AAA family ATPase [Rickettsia endosymbiont of Ixodes persulcatus]MCZ6914744.1 AAA family ATPase [Rickettsia endosymbiont of Ixodes persulcatus]
MVALLGPRQCGKTTLAHQFADKQKDVHFFDLEDIRDLAALENPYIALEGKKT